MTTDKLCIVMRGLPGSGKSTQVRALLEQHNADEDCVFSTDNQYIPLTLWLRRKYERDIEINEMVSKAEAFKDVWFKAGWSPAKKVGEPYFLNFKALTDQGGYKAAFDYLKEHSSFFEAVEYRYRWNPGAVHHAHQRNFEAFEAAVQLGMPLVIVDNTNTVPKEYKGYVETAETHNYSIKFQEPTSPHWLQYAPLLKNKYENKDKLSEFAQILFEKNTHGVPLETLIKMIDRWQVI